MEFTREHTLRAYRDLTSEATWPCRNREPDLFRSLHSMAANGCRWRAMPKEFGMWSTIYQRFRRWIQLEVFDSIEEELQAQAIDLKGIKALALENTWIKGSPEGVS